jgi:tetratricopeptide (TPR) repeat protein
MFDRIADGKLHNLIQEGQALIAEAKMPQALAVYVSALDILEQQPLEGTSIHQEVLRAVGDLHFATGDYVEAEKYLIQYLMSDSASIESARARLTLAQVYFSVHKFEQALSVLEPTIQIADRATGRDYDPSLLANALWLEALAYRENGEIELAAVSCLDAIEILSEVYGPKGRRTLLCQCTLDNLSIMRGDLSAAAASLPDVHRALRAELSPTDIDLATPLAALAGLACAVAQEVHTLKINCQGRTEDHSKDDLLELFGTYGLRGKLTKMLQDFARWVPNKDLQRATRKLESWLCRRAKAYLEEALAIQKQHLGASHPAHVELLDKLCGLSDVLNQEEQKRSYEREAARIREVNREKMAL